VDECPRFVPFGSGLELIPVDRPATRQLGKHQPSQQHVQQPIDSPTFRYHLLSEGHFTSRDRIALIKNEQANTPGAGSESHKSPPATLGGHRADIDCRLFAPLSAKLTLLPDKPASGRAATHTVQFPVCGKTFLLPPQSVEVCKLPGGWITEHSFAMFDPPRWATRRSLFQLRHSPATHTEPDTVSSTSHLPHRCW